MVFVKLSKGEYERIRDLIRGVGGNDLVREFFRQARRAIVDRSVYMLLTPDSYTQIDSWLMQSVDSAAASIAEVFRRKYRNAKRKWANTVLYEEIGIESGF